MALINPENITQYIPHRAPIIMVSTLESLSEDGTSCRTSLHIATDNILTVNGQFSESGIIENMAQSAALKAGYFFKQKNEPIPVGYIGKINDLTIHDLPQVGQTLQTSIVEKMQFGQATVVEARTMLDETLIATATLNIYTQ